MSLAVVAAVAAGGLVGAPARFLLDRWVNDRIESDIPWGTFLVNVTGSFLLGLLTGLVLHRRLGPVPDALLATGFCGSYTTFSTFSVETLRLAEDGEFLLAAGNLAGSLVFGLLAVTGGLGLGLVA